MDALQASLGRTRWRRFDSAPLTGQQPESITVIWPRPDLTVAEVVYVLESFYEVERARVAELVRVVIIEAVSGTFGESS